MRRSLLSLVVLCALAASARADTRPHPLTVTTGGRKTLFLRGSGVHRATWLDVEVYHAALYVEDPARRGGDILDGAQTIQLRLRFDRAIDRADLARAAEKGIRGQLGSRSDAFQEQLQQLRRWLRPVKRGELLALTYDGGAGVELCWNGGDCGRIVGHDFARALFSTWLGPRPLSERLKAELLDRRR